MSRHRRNPPIAVLIAIAMYSSVARAQVPDGWIVAANFRNSNSYSGSGGLFFSHPLNPGPPVQVSNVPASVTGAQWPGPVLAGADFVLRRPSDGALVTNGWAVSGVQMPLHVLTLSNASVTGVTTYNLGTIQPQSGLGIPQAAMLPGEQILIGVDNVGGPGEPLFGALLGIVNPTLGPPGTPGTVAPITVNPLPPSGNINGLAVDLQAGVTYFAMLQPNCPTTVYSVAFPAGGSPTVVATLAGCVTNLAVDNDGSVLATTCCTTSAGLYRIQPATGTVTPVTTSLGALNAVVVERATGSYVVARRDFTVNPWVYRLHRVSPNGSSTLLSSGPTGGWGEIAGLDLDPDPEVYGAPTPGASSYSWALSPNPGGLPSIGNGSFSLTIASSPAGAPGLMGASLAPLVPSVTLAGIALHIDLAQLLIAIPLAGGPSETIALPIPSDPSLSNVRVYFQTAHAELSGTLAASSGLGMTIL